MCENSICDMCGYVSENAYHFFVCPHYDAQRQVFIQSISNLHLDIPISLDLLLYGDSGLPIHSVTQSAELLAFYNYFSFCT